jgi:hypothetical protein
MHTAACAATSLRPYKPNSTGNSASHFEFDHVDTSIRKLKPLRQRKLLAHLGQAVWQIIKRSPSPHCIQVSIIY